MWHLAETRPRYEAALADEFRMAGINCFFPTQRQSRKTPNGTRKVRDVPLFARYVFFRGDEESRTVAAESRCTSRIIPIRNQNRVQAELERIEQLVNSGVPLITSSNIKIGQWCRVVSGALAGCEGTLLRKNGQHMLVIAIRTLGQQIETVIDIENVEPL